jgi:hypothetical protein
MVLLIVTVAINAHISDTISLRSALRAKVGIQMLAGTAQQ